MYSLQENYFPDTLTPGALTMKKAQEKIREFINLFNDRRIREDRTLLDLFP